MDDMSSRLMLAHELGHLINNIGNLDDSNILNRTACSIEDEIFAWGFACKLLMTKSDFYEEAKSHQFFKTTKKDIVLLLESLSKKLENMPNVQDIMKIF